MNKTKTTIMAYPALMALDSVPIVLDVVGIIGVVADEVVVEGSAQQWRCRSGSDDDAAACASYGERLHKAETR